MLEKQCGYLDVSKGFALAGEEDLGTKNKFWMERESDKARFLFKEVERFDAEGNAVEHWAEVAAAVLCEKLDIPHARYQLARYEDDQRIHRGTISEDFRRLELSDGEKVSAKFVMANEFLKKMREDYPVDQRRGVKQYTPAACASLLRALELICAPHFLPGSKRAVSMRGLLCGYLMLDALIANSDRHHENWGFTIAKQGDASRLALAPAFDNAASFCREPARKIRERLNTADKMRKADAYCRSPKAKSAFYGADGRPLSQLSAFAEFGRRIPDDERQMWMSNLRQLNPRRDLTFAFGDGCGADVVAPEAREFALQMVEVNRHRLLELPE